MGQPLGYGTPLDLRIRTPSEAGLRSRREWGLGIESSPSVIEPVTAGHGRTEKGEQNPSRTPNQLSPLHCLRLGQGSEPPTCGASHEDYPNTTGVHCVHPKISNRWHQQQTENGINSGTCATEDGNRRGFLARPGTHTEPRDKGEEDERWIPIRSEFPLDHGDKPASAREGGGSRLTSPTWRVKGSPLVMAVGSRTSEDLSGSDTSSDQELQGEGSAGDTKGQPRAPISLPLRKRRYVEPKDMDAEPTPPTKSPKRESSRDIVQNGPPCRIKREDPGDSEALEQRLGSNGLVSVNGYPQVERPQAQYSRPLLEDNSWQSPYYPVSGGPGPYLTFPVYAAHSLPPFPYSPVPCPLPSGMEDHLTTDCTMAIRQDEDGDTPLHIAVVHGNISAVQKLISLFRIARKDLDTYNYLRQTPLHLSVITKQPQLISILLSHGASPMLSDRNGQTAIHLACEYGSTECLQKILEHVSESVDLEKMNYEGFSPLHVAVNNGNKEIAMLLLERGANVDAVDNKSGRTPLIHAVEKKHVEMVNQMIQHSANVNLQTFSGNTALHSASGRGLLDIVRILLKNGADTSIKNYHNDTPLMVAKNKKVIDVLRGKATRSISQQGLNLKIPEIRKDSPTPTTSNSSSPSNMLTPTGFGCQSPNSSPHRSLVTPYLTLPSTSSPPRSASNQSCDSKSSQGQRSPPLAVSHKAGEAHEKTDSPGQFDIKPTNGFPCHGTTTAPFFTPPVMYQSTKMDGPSFPVAAIQHLNLPFRDYLGGYYTSPIGCELNSDPLLEPIALTHLASRATSGGAFVPFHGDIMSNPFPFMSVTSRKKIIPLHSDSAANRKPLAHTHLTQSVPFDKSVTLYSPESLPLPHNKGRSSSRNSNNSDASTESENSRSKGERSKQ